MRSHEFVLLPLLALNQWCIGIEANGRAEHRTLRIDDSSGGGGNDEEHEIALDPFQLELRYINGWAMTSYDEMVILETTQDFVSMNLQNNMPTFSRMELYQFVRDYMEEEDLLKVAFSGSAFFLASNEDHGTVQTNIYLSFVGETKTRYLSALQEAGMENLVNATLMSIDGTELEYRDGHMVSVDDSVGDEADIDVQNRAMNSDIRLTTIMLSLMIPSAVLCVACSVYAFRSAREINWTNQTANPDAPVWAARRVDDVDRRVETAVPVVVEGVKEPASHP